MLLEGILIGAFGGWFSLALLLIVVGRKVVKNPPEALIRTMSKAMGRTMAKQISKSHER